MLERTGGLLTPPPEADELSAAVLVEIRKENVISRALLFLMLKSFIKVSLLEQLYYQCHIIFALGNFVQLASMIAKLGCF